MEVAEEDCQRGVQLGTLSEEHEREIAKIRFMAKRGEALSHIGRFGDALRDVDAVLALCPQDEAARLLRIECLIGLKDHPSALQELRKACKDFPQNEHLRDLLVDLTAQDVVQLRPASPNNKT
jgi:tetratricopeptide (TPR) repeat protein